MRSRRVVATVAALAAGLAGCYATGERLVKSEGGWGSPPAPIEAAPRPGAYGPPLADLRQGDEVIVLSRGDTDGRNGSYARRGEARSLDAAGFRHRAVAGAAPQPDPKPVTVAEPPCEPVREESYESFGGGRAGETKADKGRARPHDLAKAPATATSSLKPPAAPVTPAPAAEHPGEGQCKTRERSCGRGKSPAPDPYDPSQGSLLAREPSGKTIGDFALRKTEVRAEIYGYLSRTRVVQHFTNPFSVPIEAVYVFPLPEDSAVNDFIMTVGVRRIRGVVRPREQAEQVYQWAKAQGYQASLLTQERPNVFTESVANVAPGGELAVELVYLHQPKYEAGEHEWVFPMVVGPRYNAATVADPEAISPQHLAADERSGRDIVLEVDVDAGTPLGEVVSPTHNCRIERTSDHRARVTLDPADKVANRDFVLRWHTGGDKPALGLMAHKSELGGFFSLVVEPQLRPRDADVTPREVTFLVDVSGSQSGLPIQMCKRIVEMCLDRLRPEDRFNVMYFASGNGQLFDRPVANTSSNVCDAKDFLRRLEAGGGTEMGPGLRRALMEKRDPRYVGFVVLLTDGFIGADEQIIAQVRKERGDTRVFCFGTGSSVNRYLLEGIAEAGDGMVQYALPRDVAWADRCVQTFCAAIQSPVLCDVELDWGGLAVHDVYPRKLRDVFAGKPITVTGRYHRGGTGWVTVRGRTGSRRVELPLRVTLPDEERGYSGLGPLWARSRIQELEVTAQRHRGWTPELQRDAIDTACAFRLASPFTAFVAVDDSTRVGFGMPHKVEVPVEVPEGVSPRGAGVR